jgi:flagellar hook-associated protein 1
MSDSIIGAGISGLRAAQLGLATTGHNISNAATPGYSRQEIVQAASTPRFSGSGYIGQGVDVTGIQRNYDHLIGAQLRHVQSQSSFYDTHLTQLKQIDDLLADPKVGLSPAIDSFFAAAHDVASRPAETANRQTMISAGQSLVTRFRDLDGRLADARSDVNARIQSSVGVINTYSQQIAKLNEQIALATSRADHAQAPNDLLDKRDNLIQELAKEVGVSVVNQGNNGVNVYLGNGQAIIVGERQHRLVATASHYDSREMEVGLETGSAVVAMQSKDLSGGKLAAYFSFRDGGLAAAQNSLGRIATSIAQIINGQHRLGQDRNGAMGTDYFSVGVPVTLASKLNTGTAAVVAGVSDTSQLVASDYRLSYDGANFQVTRLSDNNVQSFAGLPVSIDGVNIQLSSGALAAGDTFEIRPSRQAGADIALKFTDPAKIAAAAPILASASGANRGSGAISAGEVLGPTADVNLQQPVTITFTSASTFDVVGTGTGNPVGIAYTPGTTVSFNGWSIKLDGTPAAGDRFNVGPNTGGVGDNRNILKLAAIQTQPSLDGGRTTFQSAYAQLISQVGNETQEVKVSAEAQANLYDLTLQSQQATSGVNLDEEAAKLLRYQQAYQAASKVISVAQRLFDEILNIAR